MAKKIDYDKWSKDELIKEIKRIKETTYGLVWHRDLPEEKIDILINPDARTPSEMFPNEMAGKPFPVLKEVKTKAIETDKNKPTNFLIEGDNYHSLAVLNFTHENAVDLIYIDPPYNTGNKSWKYNNDYVDKEDPFHHSKFMSFLYKRLKLSKNLLKDTGIICLTIDDHEIFPVGMLMDEIFGEENRLGVITIVHNPRGRNDDKYFATMHEYALFYSKSSDAIIKKFELTEENLEKEFPYKDEISKYGLVSFMRTGNNSNRHTRPNLFYPIYLNEKKEIFFEMEKGRQEVFPINEKGEEKTWRWSKDTLLENTKDILIKETNKGIRLFKKRRPEVVGGKKPKTIWYDSKYDASSHGIALLEKIFGEKDKFPYPKSIHALIDTLKITTDKNSVVLDFFAGSGTTGHAVLELNKMDGGNRSFILCTNNENDICTEVCYPRVKKVIDGYKNQKNEKIEGLGGNLKYFTAYDFIEAKETDRNKRKLVNQSTEMLCIKESAFELVQEEDDFKIFRNNDKYLGIIFHEDSIPEYIKIIKKIKGHFCTYTFSMTDEPHKETFVDVADKVTLCAIPDVILKVYRAIFKE